MQSFKKGKAPGAAVVSLTDAAMEHELQNASSSGKDAAADPEEARLLAEIRATTRLVESFNQWTPAWESLEVGCATTLQPSCPDPQWLRQQPWGPK